ncbi:MAG: Smr/MutS family protein [Dysgonamonadaceae bacterium]|jgi:DNA mismatch repair protein MutS2|nr:Smr/MutS family protein [Dysgonamonadaceae bacterium]
MIYPENFEQKIGFDKIRQLVESKCLCALGVEKTENMSFSDNYELVEKQLHQTEEFIKIIQEEDNFPSNHFFDVRDSLKKIRIEGTYLIERELFDIRRSLQTINEIVHFFRLKEEDGNLYSYLSELAEPVCDFPRLTKQIDLILDKFGRIKDNASSELSRIRTELNRTMGSISKTLQSILRSAQSEGLVDKDVSPTMRDGRLVIPIAPALKRKLKGIVHDESASGKTVFIEPAEVVEANNRVRELESEEKREIVRILTAFTDSIRPEIPEILNSYNFLAEIDFIRAKAIFSIDIRAILPVFEDKQQIDWVHAIHPLLFLSLRKQNKQVVPLDIELNSIIHSRREYSSVEENNNTTLNSVPSGTQPCEARILLISGPNAGGKSVCLKTVGLLQYMLQCGMLIPLRENSRTGIFKDIFIDIGDEQSIENDLSTYSSHLTNMKFFVRNCTPNSLILIDEFGGGTEPQIGGAIAESLLERFNRKKCFGVITTHYQNLKHYAEEHEGVVNGAMLYDRHEMQPLFKLSIGNPGSSFAIEIAHKIGLPEDVIADASTIVGQDYINMDKYLQDIVRDKRYWESKRQNIRQQEKRLEELTARYDTDLQKINAERKDILAKAKSDAEHILAETNARIENVIREIREAQAEKEKTKSIRKSLDEFKEDILSTKETDEKIARKIQKIKDKENKKQKPKPNQPKEVKPIFKPDVIETGDFVKIKGQNTAGEVLEVQGKNIVVAFGSIKSTIKSDRLEKVSKNQLKKADTKYTFVSEQTSSSMHEKKSHFKTEIDLRGMRADEALQAVTYYIDDAIQCNIGRVRILHGTGTGALRQVVRDYLSGTHGIHNYHDEDVRFGGAGITVVEFE